MPFTGKWPVTGLFMQAGMGTGGKLFWFKCQGSVREICMLWVKYATAWDKYNFEVTNECEDESTCPSVATYLAFRAIHAFSSFFPLNKISTLSFINSIFFPIPSSFLALLKMNGYQSQFSHSRLLSLFVIYTYAFFVCDIFSLWVMT